MNLQVIFAVLSAVVVLIGAPFYLKDILAGVTKPQRTTWLIWTIQGAIAFVAQAQLGAHWSLLFVAINALGNLFVYLLALRYGVGGWSKVDVVALVIACVGVAASVLVQSPLVALIGIVLADAVGTGMTIVKTYHMPDSETSITWLALGVSALLALGSVDHWYFAVVIYPLYFAVSNFAVLCAQFAGRRRLSSPE